MTYAQDEIYLICHNLVLKELSFRQTGESMVKISSQLGTWKKLSFCYFQEYSTPVPYYKTFYTYVSCSSSRN